MEKNNRNIIHKINFLSCEIDALYHLSSVKFGLSDSESIVLYTIYDGGNQCLLSDIYKQSGISKQTINSAIRNLEKKNIVTLIRLDGRSKGVAFTESGRELAERTVARLYAAEAGAFDEWTEDEANTVIALMEKFIQSFGKQIEKL